MNSNQQVLRRKIIYVFQGGGALGSFQVGGVEALHENGYHADMVVGISIGGINAAIIAGNPPSKRIHKLKSFWRKITTDIPVSNPQLGGDLSKLHNYWGAVVSLTGRPGFYTPRLINPFLLNNQTPDKLSFYDTSPLKETLNELIDFKYLNKGNVRLCLGATDLASGDFVFFDNAKEEITVEHVMSSGALPPGFPAIKINDKYYVDGGVYANTPLSMVLDEFATNRKQMKHVLCFMFDLFSASGPLPHSMDGMLERIKDIQYSSHSKRSGRIYATTQNLSHAIHFLGEKLDPQIRKNPQIKEILKLGLAHRLDLVHLVYRSQRGTELNSKDYNFSAQTSQVHWQQGYKTTFNIIKEKQFQWQKNRNQGTVVYTMDGDEFKTIPLGF